MEGEKPKDKRGLKCPHCDCRHPRVPYLRPARSAKPVRRREYGHFGNT